MKTNSYSIDWNNVDLNDNHQRNQNLLEPYDFDTLLLEINCNIKTENLNPETIKKHFDEVIRLRVEEAKEIFEANLDNIVKQAKNERNN